MFYYIKGPLTLLKPGLAVIEAGGVGYRMTVSDRTYEAISGKNDAKLYTYLAVREDGVELFGFHTESEMDTFQLLTTVSGVGPKAAMAILSQFTPEQFVLAVCAEDRKSIAKANGIGPKIAARIILELHDKLAASTSFPSLPDTQESALPDTAVGATSALRAQCDLWLTILLRERGRDNSVFKIKFNTVIRKYFANSRIIFVIFFNLFNYT